MTRCSEIRERLPQYFDDVLAAGEGRLVKEHLSECEACREEAAAVEPSVLFALLPAGEVSSEDVARVLAGVRAGVAWRETEAKLGAARSRRRRRMAAVASAAALAAMTLVLPGSGRRAADTVTASAPRAAAREAPGFAPAARRDPAGTFPADATIYDWNPGAATSEPRVVWIVDRSLDI